MNCETLVKKAQRPHQCEWCGENIPKHSSYIKRAYVFDGEFNSAHQHIECHKAMSGMSYSDLQEGFGYGDFMRGSTRTR